MPVNSLTNRLCKSELAITISEQFRFGKSGKSRSANILRRILFDLWRAERQLGERRASQSGVHELLSLVLPKSASSASEAMPPPASDV